MHGSSRAITPKHANVTSVGIASFRAPEVDKSTRARLLLKWVSRDGQVALENYVDLYFFPRHIARAESRRVFATSSVLTASLRKLGYEVVDEASYADVVVTDKVTDALREYMLQGGHVLWIVENSNPKQQTYLNDLRVVAREDRAWEGNWASNMNWIARDKMFKDIPTDGMVDFAFADFTPDYVILGVHPYDFATDVHAGLFVGWIHSPVPLVVERRIGRGRMIVCTFRLGRHVADHPVAAVMVRDMISALGQHQ